MINLSFSYPSTLPDYNITVNMHNKATDISANKDFDAEVSHMETASELKVDATHVLIDANRQSYFVKKVCSCLQILPNSSY